MRLRVRELEAALGIDAARGREAAVGPQRHLLVALAAREGDALVHEAPAQAQPARGRREDQHAQLRHGGRLAHHEDRADALAVELGDPAALPFGLELEQELARDARHERFEAVVPAVFARVQLAVLLHHPADVARRRVTQHGGLGPGRRCGRFEQRLHRVHGLHQLVLLRRRQRGEQGGGFVARFLLQRRKRGMADFGQAQHALAGVARVRLAREPAVGFEAAQDAAEVAGVETQVAPDLAGDGGFAVRQLVEHAHVGQRQVAAQVGVEGADAARVEAVEPADGLDGGRVDGGRWRGHGCHCHSN
ncbi:hypothetical protein D3C71_1009180 [compost metagenome]